MALKFPTESVIQTLAQTGSRSKDIDIMEGILGSFERGLNVSETIRPIVERRRRREEIAGFLGSPEGVQFTEEFGVGKDILARGLEEDPLGIIKLSEQRKLADIESAFKLRKAAQPKLPKELTASQKAKIRGLKKGIKAGFVSIGKQFGEPTEFEVKTKEDALRAIRLSLAQGVPISDVEVSELLEPFEIITVKDKKGRIGNIPKNQLSDALKEGFTVVK
jgi:hypothetical protein